MTVYPLSLSRCLYFPNPPPSPFGPFPFSESATSPSNPRRRSGLRHSPRPLHPRAAALRFLQAPAHPFLDSTPLPPPGSGCSGTTPRLSLSRETAVDEGILGGGGKSNSPCPNERILGGCGGRTHSRRRLRWTNASSAAAGNQVRAHMSILEPSLLNPLIARRAAVAGRGTSWNMANSGGTPGLMLALMHS